MSYLLGNGIKLQDLNSGKPVTELGSFKKVAFLGGVYSNYLALEKALSICRNQEVDQIFMLGDFGAFGPYPNRSIEIAREAALPCIQGNYEESLSSGAEDCHCGYTDPRDNHFARLSYDYTLANTSDEHKSWMGTLPAMIRIQMGKTRVLLCHGSPRKINEFLWETTTPEIFIEKLLKRYKCDLIVCTHTGLHWSRFLSPQRGIINCGALGRPPNNGKTEVWFSIAESTSNGIHSEFIPVEYDFNQLTKEMISENLPIEFIETIQVGWWTTCLEIMPVKERSMGKF